jgi:putative transposase
MELESSLTKDGLMKRARFTEEQIIAVLKALEEENTKLKKLLAEQMLGGAALRELMSKKW